MNLKSYPYTLLCLLFIFTTLLNTGYFVNYTLTAYFGYTILTSFFAICVGLSQIYLKLDDPRNTDVVVKNLKALLEDYPILSTAELASLLNSAMAC